MAGKIFIKSNAFHPFSGSDVISFFDFVTYVSPSKGAVMKA